MHIDFYLFLYIIYILYIYINNILYIIYKIYTYILSLKFDDIVLLYYRSCNEQKGICSFPYAYVQLTNKQQLLMVGQPYKVNLHLEMPESPANKELGNF